jgi:hypothetical protein
VGKQVKDSVITEKISKEIQNVRTTQPKRSPAEGKTPRPEPSPRAPGAKRALAFLHLASRVSRPSRLGLARPRAMVAPTRSPKSSNCCKRNPCAARRGTVALRACYALYPRFY